MKGGSPSTTRRTKYPGLSRAYESRETRGGAPGLGVLHLPFQAVPSHLLSRMRNYAGCPGDLLGRRFPRVGLGCLTRYQPPVHLSAQEVSPHRAYVQWRGRARDFPFPHVCRTSARVIPPCGAYIQWRGENPMERNYLTSGETFSLHPTKVDAGRRNFGRCIACTLSREVP